MFYMATINIFSLGLAAARNATKQETERDFYWPMLDGTELTAMKGMGSNFTTKIEELTVYRTQPRCSPLSFQLCNICLDHNEGPAQFPSAIDKMHRLFL